ncbi:recombinase family protein [Saccharococcus caldoxylosilyticus]|uniref:recombinase family protein n=1 Tax=Saccharococcus caldoxylosilyticus TaxID=81408 RepID=UPI003D32DE54
MRVALYYRVSTKLQEDKYSLAAQKEELTKYAESQGWNIVGEFKDVESGGKLEKKGLTALLDLVDEGGVDVVLVVDQDRLSRLDTVAWEYLKSVLRDNNVKIAEPGNIIDLNNEDDEFISDIKNLIAKREKRAIVRRLMRGKRQRMREGKGWGLPPFEYQYDRQTGKYKAKPEWKWVIPFIDNLYLNEQLGMKAISDRLNEISKTPTGKPWNEHLVHTRLVSKAFHGVMEKAFANGETISIPGIYEPLRTEETYRKIQEEREKRGEQFSVSGRKSSDKHILKRTRIICGECGRKIQIARHGTKEKPVYYAKHGRKERADGSVCDININTIRFDKNIMTALKEILSSEEQAKKYINLDIDQNELNTLKKNVKTLNKKISKLQESLDRLLDLYLAGGLKKEKYLEKQKQLESQIEIYKKELDKNELKLKSVESNIWNYEYLYEYLEVISDLEKELTPLERAQLVGKIFPTATLYREKLILTADVKGIPVDIEIPIDPDPYPWHPKKRNTYTK